MPGDSIREILDQAASASEAGTLDAGAPAPAPVASSGTPAAPAPVAGTPAASAPATPSGTPAAAPGAPVATAGAPAAPKPEGPGTKPELGEDGQPVKQNIAAVITQKAPGTWTPAAREHWNSVPQEVREEVLKREREVSRAMTQSSQARQFQQEFHQAIQPYMANIQAQGATPVQAIQTMFNIDHQLRSGPPASKAQLVAALCRDFGIDLELLDHALAGVQPPASKTSGIDPAEVQRLVQAQLAPFQQSMQQQNQNLMAEIAGEVDTELSTFASTHEFYNDVKEDMADIIELGQRRGMKVSLTDAYERATLLSVPVRAVMEQRKAANAGQQAHQVAQQAKAGAFGIKPSAETGTTNLPAGDSIRDALERSIAHHSGRVNG